MDIWRAAEVLNRRKWLILFSIIVAVVLTYGATRLTGSRFEATVRLISPQTASRVAAGSTQNNQQGNDMDSGVNSKALKSLYTSILMSPDVIGPAFRKTKEPIPAGTNLFRDVEFEVTGPRLYELKVTSSKPEKAGMLANALAESFVRKNHSLNTEEAGKVVHLLQAQMHLADAELTRARGKYRTYSSLHKVVGTPEEEARSAHSEIDEARSRRNSIQQDLVAATAQMTDAQRRLAEMAPTLSQIRPLQSGPHAKAVADELDKIETRLASLQARYGSEYPEVKESIAARDTLRTRLQTAQREETALNSYDDKDSLNTTLKRNVADLTPKIAGLQAQLSALDGAIIGAESRVQQANNLGDPYGSLASEVAARTEERTGLAARLNNSLMALDVAQRQNPIVIMEPVNDLNPPLNITSGKTRKLILLAALCALIGACGIVIALDSLDRRLKSVGETELLLPTRVLASIPQPEGQMSYSALARIAELNPRSLPAEAYRFLGMHLLSSGEAQMRSLMVVSAKAEQGSTTTIANLAITLAQAGRRVVLVDTNVRTPELHKVFEMENEFGFTDLLMDPTARSFEKAMLTTTVDNLRVITSGSAPENPWELFRSENLQAVSRRLRDTADYVLYDTPSGVLFTDALNLAPIVDGAFLCIRALETPTGMEKRLIDMIDQADVKMLGAVLTDVPVSLVAGYENYQHYYALGLPPLPIGALGTNSTNNLPKSGTAPGAGIRPDRHDDDSGSVDKSTPERQYSNRKEM